ncbi:MAG: VWA domain-containing protein [Sulfuricurvum sp.]|jgi:Ca-activated chloride channel family protein|uniref:vWA domain-containing protein n=1 Tax=Sulfuricurvum sp. TaxID=2025608 RepID=UPI0025D05325|nr:VWA domain-containing protein [Sulfuricurvum sp.]MCK9373157.1 VWA domain-containing protein [Sulfuricurvum sp.]
MTFLTPLWLIGLVPVLGYRLLARRYRWRLDVQQQWLLVSVVLVMISLARPVIPQKPLDVQQKGSDVILAVDLSYSMRGSDILPSRLEAAKKLLHDVVRRDRRDRFGVIGFTTSAIILSPLTKDTELLEHLFDALDESQIITKGTQVMSALELARKMSHARRPQVILLTDGGDETSYEKEADFIRENDLAVSVVMLASSGGSTLPTQSGEWLKDEAGHIVVSSRNDAITALVHANKGELIHGPDTDGVLGLIEGAGDEDFEGSSSVMRTRELFAVPLVLALMAFVLAMTSVGEKLSKRLAWLLALVGIGANGGVLDFVTLYQAKNGYLQKGYERSASLYGEIDSPQARYNRGNALYKAGKIEAALGAYRSVKSNNPLFKSLLYYNMGNCYIRLREFEKARESLLKSLTLHYDKAADANLHAIAEVPDYNLSLNVRKEKNDKFSQEQAPPSGDHKKSKEGGGSNMKSDTAASGGGDEGKKTQGDPRLSLSQGKAALSSRQYELINQRSVHETKPW